MKEDELVNDKSVHALISANIEPVTRRQDTNWLSRNTFYSFLELIKRGSKRDLTINDFQLIDDLDECENLSQQILDHFKLEKQPNLWWILFKVYWKQSIKGGLLNLIEAFVQIGQGYSLSLLLKWYENPANITISPYYLALSLSLATFIHGVIHHAEFFINMRTGMRVRVGLIATLYRKCLLLSTSNTASTGLIVNLVSNDVQRFEDASYFMHYVWLIFLIGLCPFK